MKNWYLIPLAAVAGLIAGAWGPRSDLETLKEMKSEKTVKAEANAKSGFGAIANLVNIPQHRFWMPAAQEISGSWREASPRRLHTASAAPRLKSVSIFAARTQSAPF